MFLTLASKDRQSEKIYECDHITIKRLPDRVEVGVVQRGRKVTLIVLPDDGDVIYQTNNEGKTVHRITFSPVPPPPPPAPKVREVVVEQAVPQEAEA